MSCLLQLFLPFDLHIACDRKHLSRTVEIIKDYRIAFVSQSRMAITEGAEEMLACVVVLGVGGGERLQSPLGIFVYRRTLVIHWLKTCQSKRF